MALHMDPGALRSFGRPRPVAAIDPAAYAAVILAGGHGALWDFPDSATLGRLVAATLAGGRPVLALDHGTAGLLASGPSGKPVAAGYRVTGPTDAEERAAGWAALVPFSLEARLRAAGAAFTAKGILLENVVRDGPLVTAQNAGSAGGAVEALAGMLEVN